MISPRLDALLDPKHVLLNLKSTSAAEAIWEIVELLRENGELSNAKKFFEAVMAREEKASTMANGGVAFPHARTNLVEQILLGIGRSGQGIKFGESANLVHLIFLIGVPQQMVNDYLICLGGLARRLSNEQTRQTLLSASTTAEFLDRLRGEE